ncbi:MAG TPA: cytochrome b/b6 [Rhodospirillales bacterium]|jgi:quinol-cytochrome oxidoreductase complex cytochrome b subunit|nr:cytochrome b/b6 [Rhodospirillales bacterium]
MATPIWNNPVIKWIDYRLPLFTFMHKELVDYPAPKNLNYWWNFGSLAGIVLVILMVTGILLTAHYTPHVDHAFDSVERIMRDVNYGWLLRYLHMNGGSVFFFIVYIHMFRGLYYGSYKKPRELLWIIGVLIVLIMMGTAFMGYVLPWGQMSYWAATVITNMFSAVPAVGDDIVKWLWGGFTVGNATLNRFYSWHYLLPFIIFALVFLHLWALHVHKSNNPLGVEIKGPKDKIPFHPYYTVKDAFGLGVLMIVYMFFVFFFPNFFLDVANYIPANPMVTPAHIVPEWYLMPFYAVLRAITFDLWFIPAKLIGVIAMFASICILFFLPWLDRSPVRSAKFRPIYKQFFWIFVIDCVVLGIVGANPPEGMFIPIGQAATAYYFAHFIIITPILGLFEKPKAVPGSISEAVTAGGASGKVAG